MIFIPIFLSLLFAQEERFEDVNQTFLLLEKEAKYEREKTAYLQGQILDKILGPGKAVVTVDVELGLEIKKREAQAKEIKAEKKKEPGEIEYLLPGIPLPRTFTGTTPPKETKEDLSTDRLYEQTVKVVIKRQKVTVIHDEKVTEEQLLALKDAIATAIALDPKRDLLEFKKTKFTTPILQQFLKPNLLIPLAISLLLLFSLFGMLGGFLKNYLRVLKERAGAEIRVDSRLEGGLPAAGVPGGAPGGAAVLGPGGELMLPEKPEEEKEEEKEEEAKYEPFAYLNEENVKKLVYLLRREDPRTIALVLSYLKPEFVQEVINGLPPNLQTQVAIALAFVKQSSKEEIMKLDATIKEKIDYLVGGPDDLLRVMDNVDEETQINILEYLKNERPELYEIVRKFVILFEDIVSFPDLAVQTIIRDVGPERLGRALRDAPPEIMNKFLSNMSAGAAALLKEEMEYGRPLSPEEISDEKKRIVNIIKNLEKEGKIYIRERPKTLIAKEFEEMPTTPPPEFQQYFQTAVEVYNQEKYDEALQYFQYCMQLYPNSPDVYKYLGNIYYSYGQYNEAITYYEKAIELDPSDESLKNWVQDFKATITV